MIPNIAIIPAVTNGSRSARYMEVMEGGQMAKNRDSKLKNLTWRVGLLTVVL